MAPKSTFDPARTLGAAIARLRLRDGLIAPGKASADDPRAASRQPE